MTKFNPKVSIIIPVYNGSNYLKEAIDSALAQTYKNIEVIVINDGSDDKGKTEKIAKSYGNKIRYFKKENGGVATALNLGIEKMVGDYFSWLSHDDVYKPDKIEKQILFLKNLKNKEVVLFSNYEVIDQKSNHIDDVIADHSMLMFKPKNAILRGAINGITLLVPKNAFKKFGTFNISLKYTQDYDLWWKFIKHYNFLHMEDILAGYRIHSNQASNFSQSSIESETRWMAVMEYLTKKEKEKLEGSEYCYYLNMYAHLLKSSHTKARDLANDKRNAIYKKVVNKIDYKISVIIPCYNQGRFIDRAVNSVLAQTYKNFEIIIINDGSTDEYTKKRLKQYKKPNTKVYHTKNQGSFAARKYGVSKSSGDYIQFLDADDYIHPRKFEEQIKVFNVDHNANVCYTSYEYYIEEIDQALKPGLSMVLSDDPLKDFIYRWQRSLSIPLHAAMFEKELLNQSIDMELDIKSTEDWILWINLSRNGAKFSRIDLPMATYSVHKSSKTQKDKRLLFYWACRSVAYIANHYILDKEADYYNSEQAAYLSNLAQALLFDQSQVFACKSQIDSLENKNQELNDKINLLLGSNSWRITKPLRTLGFNIKRLK